jgi:predicted 3-demethylubiquinone-9 3-methyltransferase (glyoxalase superfamily)
MDTKVFEIVKVVGLGIKESMDVEHSTGLLFFDEVEAHKQADKLWKEETSSEERNSGWCAIHYIVKERNVK